MNKLAHQLKLYDKFLQVKKLLNGTVKIYRQSPFSQFRFDVLAIQNQYIGSCRWILKKINLKDTQRYNIVGETLKNNWTLRHKKDDNRVHQEIADFMLNDQIVL